MDKVLEVVGKINSAINSVVWGWPMIILILGTGIFLTVCTKVLQVRKFGTSWKETIIPTVKSIGKKQKKLNKKEVTVSPFEAFATAISGTVGTGNLIGVTSAIMSGGPGAVFWMWISAFFGMVTNYAENVLGRPEPKVGLLNIGVEPSKGTSLQTTVYPMLKEAGEAGRINFVGNVEARDAVEGAVDVIVCDGYSGNIFLKTMEGTGLFLAREMKSMFKKNLLTKIAAVLVSDGIKHIKKLLSSDEVGGTALLGISKTVIKAHGSSDAFAIKNAVRQAKDFAASGIIENITENIDQMKLDSAVPEKG